MRFLSVCSGIEAASVAWAPLGWQALAFAEIEPFPCAVLAHHYPTVPNHGDITRFQKWPDHAVDLVCGGTPCQAFSVAGLRQGLADPRGNLSLTFLAIVDRYRPQWVVWENVPGVLSSDGGRDFGAFLGGLGKLGYGWCYRVLDAQYVRVDGFPRAVPQRRRRVFVVGCLGDWRRAAAVLSEPDSVLGDTPPRRGSGSGAACGTLGGTSPGGGWRFGADEAAAGQLIALDVAPNMTTRTGTGRDGMDDYVVAQTIAFNGRQDPDVTGDRAGCLNGMSPQDQCIAWAIGSHAGAADGFQTNRSHSSGGPVGANISKELAYSLRSGRTQSVATSWSVRRLTPRECERLQGFPDDYTAIPFRGKPAADGPRYKALGNSWAVNCARWIGRRIEMVEEVSASLALEVAE